MEQKLYQAMKRVRDTAVMNGLQDISAGVDIAYEAGRRIGARQGMDLMLKAFTDAVNEANDQDRDDRL